MLEINRSMNCWVQLVYLQLQGGNNKPTFFKATAKEVDHVSTAMFKQQETQFVLSLFDCLESIVYAIQGSFMNFAK